MQMIIQRIWPLAKNHPASCQLLCRGFTLLQMIIHRIRPLANDHLEGLPSYKLSSRGSGLLQLIIWPLATDPLEHPASCKCSSRGSSLLQMTIQGIRHLSNYHPEDLASCHPYHLSQDLDSILRTFLEQFALVIGSGKNLNTATPSTHLVQTVYITVGRSIFFFENTEYSDFQCY